MLNTLVLSQLMNNLSVWLGFISTEQHTVRMKQRAGRERVREQEEEFLFSFLDHTYTHAGTVEAHTNT